jgi:methylenetetrahydrofolate--tRNA-(uracil-5-)-methyltransferase
MLGGLFRYQRSADPARFQPMNSNWGLVDPLAEDVRDRKARRERLHTRALADFRRWMEEQGVVPRPSLRAARDAQPAA